MVYKRQLREHAQRQILSAIIATIILTILMIVAGAVLRACRCMRIDAMLNAHVCDTPIKILLTKLDVVPNSRREREKKKKRDILIDINGRTK